MKNAKQLKQIGHGKNPLNTPKRKLPLIGFYYDNPFPNPVCVNIINESAQFITVNNHSGHDLQPGDPVYADQIENSNPFSFPIMINRDLINQNHDKYYNEEVIMHRIEQGIETGSFLEQIYRDAVLVDHIFCDTRKKFIDHCEFTENMMHHLREQDFLHIKVGEVIL